MTLVTNEQLIALGKKILANRERDKLRAKARNSAIKKLIATHEAEFQKYLKEAGSALGL
jgi:hypothetical protein